MRAFEMKGSRASLAPRAVTVLAACAALLASPCGAHALGHAGGFGDTALSDTSDMPAAGKAPQAMPPAQLPMPEAGSKTPGASDDESEPDDVPVDDTTTDDPAKEKNVNKPAAPLPIFHDLSKLPEPVRRMRQLIMEAAQTGDLDKLRPLLGRGATQTQLAIGADDSDPIAYLHSVSGDKGGQEILAILLDVLDTGFVDMNKGKPDEAYVWPYFFTTPLDGLTAPERVELFRIITAGDFEDMKAYGGYNFYRVGIAPDGSWKFFLAGD